MEKKIAKVKDAPGFVRDMTNRAVINVDENSLTAYKKKRQYDQRVEQAVDDINTVKRELNDIKSLLTQLLNKKAE